MTVRPIGMSGLAYGGDYNPEQWPRETWLEDARLMQEAGVNLVSLGIFSWGLLEPAPGRFDFGWLDDVVTVLASHDIRIDLATATASTPNWLAHEHPEVLPVDQDGRTLWPGSRQAWCPSSPIYREHAARLVEQMATRYGTHDSLAMWHVGNEYGCHNARCYCDESARDFRRWLTSRYGDIERLNDAWATAFWSQHYTDFEQVLPPRATPTFHNPAQLLDFRRFSSDASLACFTMERDVLHELSPGVPVTTNFMVGHTFDEFDYWRWAAEVDIVSNDHYLESANPQAHVELAMSADLTRGLADGKPWILMEHSTSAVNWQPRNRAKESGELTRNSLQHVARGADGVLFFQWRASRGGAEKFHSGMLPHAGTDTKIWREVVGLGERLQRLEPVAASTSRADVAIIYDWESGWAVSGEATPSRDVEYRRIVEAVYSAVWHQGVSVDFVAPGDDLSRFAMVAAPCLHMVSDAEAAALTHYVESGGCLLMTYFSGLVDRDDKVRLGGYPGRLTALLGLVIEEFFPLQQGESVELDDASTAKVWTEHISVDGAEVLRSFASGPLSGGPAVTHNVVGKGHTWYVGTHLDEGGWLDLVSTVCHQAAIPETRADGVERVTRTDGSHAYTFVINHSDTAQQVGVSGRELLTGKDVDELDRLPAGEVAVVRTPARRRG